MAWEWFGGAMGVSRGASRSGRRAARRQEALALALHGALAARPADRELLAATVAIPDRAVDPHLPYRAGPSWAAMLCPRMRLRRFRVRRRVGRVRVYRTPRAQSRWLGWGARQAVEGLCVAREVGVCRGRGSPHVAKPRRLVREAERLVFDMVGMSTPPRRSRRCWAEVSSGCAFRPRPSRRPLAGPPQDEG